MRSLLIAFALVAASAPLVGNCGCCCGKGKSAKVAATNEAPGYAEKGATVIPVGTKVKILERRILHERSKAYKRECAACKGRGEKAPVYCAYDYVRKGWNFKRKDGDVYFVSDPENVVLKLKSKVDELRKQAK